MPLIATKGAASVQGFGEFAQTAVATYIEDVFSTWLYTGNGSTQTITNGVDLSTYGGLTWLKRRDSATGGNHNLFDTARGVGNYISSNLTSAQANDSTTLTAWSTTGFSLGASTRTNTSAATYASWTFRKQPKFFDVVTYTGNGVQGRQISHNLGSTPGCIIVRATAAAGWVVYHRSLQTNYVLFLQSTGNAANAGSPNPYVSAPTSTTFTVGNDNDVNASGVTFVAYLFAHDAGGFGLTGTDNVISCGSLTSASGGSATLTLNYEPQWILFKRTDAVGDWFMFDNMRGMLAPSSLGNSLYSNTSGAEVSAATRAPYVTSTSLTWDGVTNTLDSSGTYIYIAIRRGPMKTPTNGTSVFNAITRTGTGAAATITGIGFAPDLVYPMCRNDVANKGGWVDKLRGASANLITNLTDAETTNTSGVTAFGNTSISVGTSSFFNSALNYVNYFFVRAPGFFDEVIVVTNGQTAPITSTHNLTVVPEMMIGKKRGPTGGIGDWSVYHKGLNGGVNPQNYRIRFNKDFAAGAASGVWNNTAPTATQFTIGTDADVNSGTAGDTSVFWLFASCPGVSKVGSYSGTGALQTINCGFTSGARFVLIKRTDSTGDWWVYDSARGITSGNDPYLFLNSTAAEVTGTNYVDTDTTGFKVTAAAPAGLNASGGTYIFLAIA